MPRRPRLSIPPMLQESREGYVLWDTEGLIVDRNASFRRMTGELEDESSFTDALNPVSAALRPPESAFRGLASEEIVANPVDATMLYRLDVWPITDENGEVIAVLGRTSSAEPESLCPVIDPARLWGKRLHEEVLKRRATAKHLGLDTLVGHGPAHESILRRIESAAKADCSVVIIGESGTGRHHLARLLHSRRQAIAGTRHPLVPLDPRSLPSEMLARDFLGLDFASDSQRAATSLPNWRVPDGATVLLENLAGLDKLLQDGIRRARGRVTLIGLAASFEDLKLMDPWFRASMETMVFALEPLRNRIDEIPLMAQFLLDRIQSGRRRHLEGFSTDALDRLRMYDWPGNWREFERVVKIIHEQAAGPLVTSQDVPAGIQGAYGGAWVKPTGFESTNDRLEEAVDQVRASAVRQALSRFGSNKAAAARALGVSRPKLYRLIAELGLE